MVVSVVIRVLRAVSDTCLRNTREKYREDREVRTVIVQTGGKLRIKGVDVPPLGILRKRP